MMIIFILIINLIIGILIGISGIAGFLLPLTYVGFLNFEPTLSLCLSFLAFLTSGVVSSIYYYKKQMLRLEIGKYIAAGCIIGSTIAIYLSNFMSQEIVKILMYIVVLISGMRLIYPSGGENYYSSGNKSPLLLVLIGIFIAIFCTLSGAGGPVLLVPLLMNYNINALESVATSLFLSVFIAVPSFVGYISKINISDNFIILLTVVISHGVGCLIGNKIADKIKMKQLKRVIGLGTVFVSLYMLSTMVI